MDKRDREKGTNLVFMISNEDEVGEYILLVDSGASPHQCVRTIRYILHLING
ncbi:Down syndrome cell adhesion molecule-like protein 1-like protein isoform [Sesbania bispinosa]|nr:Down syndrome cell adhesion molecule-like protein 1-like protein isoform [Sesbania bispinosa]